MTPNPEIDTPQADRAINGTGKLKIENALGKIRVVEQLLGEL